MAGDYPLYYDAVNEKGLGMAGLNFVGNAVYQEPVEDKENVAQFEFIPWVLSQCAVRRGCENTAGKHESDRNTVLRGTSDSSVTLDDRGQRTGNYGRICREMVCISMIIRWVL